MFFSDSPLSSFLIHVASMPDIKKKIKDQSGQRRARKTMNFYDIKVFKKKLESTEIYIENIEKVLQQKNPKNSRSKIVQKTLICAFLLGF